MTVDYTKDKQTSADDKDDSLTLAIRHGITRRYGWAGIRLAFDKLTGEVPPGIDAPTKTTRKVIAGSWALLKVVRFSVLALLLLLMGIGCCFAGAYGALDFKLLSFGVGCLIVSAVSTRWAIRAARNLRSVARA